MLADELERLHEAVLQAFSKEEHRARSKFGDFHSAHEGFAVLLEEVDELWDAVRLQEGDPERADSLRLEAIQVGAMALRFVVDVCGGLEG